MPTEGTIPPAVVDAAGAADYIQTTPRHIRALWQRRELPAVKIGSLVRFRIADLDEYITQHRVPARKGAKGAA